MSLTILHLSDIHLSTEKMTDFTFVRRGLLTDLEQRNPESSPVDLVVFSGDLVQSGNDAEGFRFAKKELFDPVLKVLDLDYSRLFLCPGNHDIDRDDVRANPDTESGLKSTLTDRNRLNSFIDKNLSEKQEHVRFSRLQHFTSFRSTIADLSAIRQTPFFATYIREIGSEKIGVAALNTAWRATGEKDNVDYGQLLLGERSVTEAYNDIKSCSLKVAVFHHPREWLQEFDRNDCWPLLVRDFDLIMTGHMHRSKPEGIYNPMGQAVLSESGALYVSREYFNGYCMIALDRTARKVHFSIRRYEDSRQTFEAATNVAANGEFEIQLASAVEVERLSDLSSCQRALRPILSELAIEKLVAAPLNDNPLKSLKDFYVRVPITSHGGTQRRPPWEVTRDDELIDDAEILSSEIPVVIFGGRETGKTILGLKLASDACDGLVSSPKLPIYIDLAPIKLGTGNIERAAQQFLRRSGVNIESARHLGAGDCLIILDNAPTQHGDNRAVARKLDMISDFVRRYSKNKYIILADEPPGVSLQLQKFDLSIGHKSYHLLPLRRREIEELAKRLLEPIGRFSDDIVNTVERRLAASRLPRTPQVVTMVLWTLAREKTLGPINEATLLERFVEACLQKASAYEIERGDFASYHRELDIFTGLTRTDHGLLKALEPALEEGPPAYSPADADSYYQDMALVQYDPIAAAREYLNSADARDENEPNDPNDLIELDFGTPQHDLVDQIYNYITTLQLFARIVRNCELLPDVSLKARATDIVIHKWSKLVISGSQAYDALLNEKETPDEIQASFNALDQKQKGLLEKLMKCYGPVMSIFMLYDCIGTRFLGKTLEDVLAKHETKWSIDKFILIGTLLLIVYLDGYAGKERLLRQLRDVIADRQTKLIHLYLLLNLLEPLYGSPALSRVGQEDILPILADIHLAILGIRPGPQSAYGSQRSKLLSKLRVARSRAS